MKAITLWQPYATAIALGVKRVETRPRWALRLRSMIGEDIAVHAAVRNPAPGQDFGMYRTARTGDRGSATVLHQLAGPGPLLGIRSLVGVHPLPLGAVVAVARIEAVVPMRGEDDDADPDQMPYIDLRMGPSWCTWANPGIGGWAFRDLSDERAWGTYTSGRIGVALEDVRPLAKPVACRGYQQVWTLDSVAEAMVNLELSLAAARDARDKVAW